MAKKKETYSSLVKDTLREMFPEADEETVRDTSRSYTRIYRAQTLPQYIEFNKKVTRVIDRKGLIEKIKESIRKDPRISERMTGEKSEEDPIIRNIADSLRNSKRITPYEAQKLLGFKTLTELTNYTNGSDILGEPKRFRGIRSYSTLEFMDFLRYQDKKGAFHRGKIQLP